MWFSPLGVVPRRVGRERRPALPLHRPARWATLSAMNTVRRIVLVVALALPSAAIADMSGRARVLSGDTFAIGDDVIRLYGVDAPEPRQTCERDGVVRSCGAEATGSLRGIIGGNEVRCDDGTAIAMAGSSRSVTSAPWIWAP